MIYWIQMDGIIKHQTPLYEKNAKKTTLKMTQKKPIFGGLRPPPTPPPKKTPFLGGPGGGGGAVIRPPKGIFGSPTKWVFGMSPNC